ncbi:hypothetical protein Y032_0763g2142 [Ancylostoma ceylanicum]|uniref:Globin domain-containing protein n=1 Tax=Ancylostoma ceylanicum TaxID=53326 RepID=A0A016WDY7_9BILA|nr:hypothetical protein Y032_0763g2142 [Ancylostoma ceylanicum]
MGVSHSATNEQKKEKVERLFRQNIRSSRSRSLDCRNDRPTRPVGGSHSARYPRTKCKLLEDGVNGSISGLTQDEKRLIEVCWFKCTQKQLKKCAEDIFSDILHTDESLLKLFRLESLPSNRLRENEYFKAHSANFSIVLNLVVTSIGDNFEQTCEALQTLGYQHVSLRDHGFQTIYWDIFTDCFERNRPPSFRKDAEKEAWSRMILFILSQMKVGYHRGLADRKMERLSVPVIY